MATMQSCPKCSRQMSRYAQLKKFVCHYCDEFTIHYHEVKQITRTERRELKEEMKAKHNPEPSSEDVSVDWLLLMIKERAVTYDDLVSEKLKSLQDENDRLNMVINLTPAAIDDLREQNKELKKELERTKGHVKDANIGSERLQAVVNLCIGGTTYTVDSVVKSLSVENQKLKNRVEHLEEGYHVFYSEEDEQYAAVEPKKPSCSWLANCPKDALKGLINLGAEDKDVS